MGEKTPDSERSGIERRDILKGLGFGAMGLAGVGAFVGSAAAQDGREMRPGCDCNPGMIDYAHLVPPGEDPDKPKGNYPDAPDGGMDLVFQLDEDGMPEDGDAPIGYQVVLIRQSNNEPATKSVEDGRTKGFAGTMFTTPGGETQRREEFSTAGLRDGTGPTDYWTVLTVMDYSQLPDTARQETVVVPVQIT